MNLSCVPWFNCTDQPHAPCESIIDATVVEGKETAAEAATEDGMTTVEDETAPRVVAVATNKARGKEETVAVAAGTIAKKSPDDVKVATVGNTKAPEAPAAAATAADVADEDVAMHMAMEQQRALVEEKPPVMSAAAATTAAATATTNDDRSTTAAATNAAVEDSALGATQLFAFLKTMIKEEEAAKYDINFDVSQSVQCYLGGLSAGRNNCVPPDTVYGRLRRKAATDLPGLHSSSRQFQKDETRIAFMAAFNGGFKATCCEHYPGNTSLFMTRALSSSPNAAKRQVAVFNAAFAPESGWQMSLETSDDSQALTFKQRTALNLRMLHLVVRSQGSALPNQLGTKACEYLIQRYQAHKWWVEAVDCAIILADIAFNNDVPQPIKLARAIVTVGESLECEQQFKQAALLYAEVVELYFIDADASAVRTVCANCALAHKRAGDYSAAEEAYVDALRRAIPTPMA